MIYLYDGTRDGFLTAFLTAFSDENAVLISGQGQLSLGQETVIVKTDSSCAERVAKRLKMIDRFCLDDLNLMLRSGDADRDRTMFGYFKLIAKKHRAVRGMLALTSVIAADECMRKVRKESEHLKGFLRFMETACGALYAPVSPDNDIIDLLAVHFRARLPQFPFLIHDIKRCKAVLYDGEKLIVTPLEQAEIMLAADETAWQNLWKKYFKHVNIPSRERLKQQLNYLPKRYRRFMTEF